MLVNRREGSDTGLVVGREVQMRAATHRGITPEIVRAGGFFAATVAGGLLGRLTLIEDLQVVLISPLTAISLLWLLSSHKRSWWWDIPLLALAQVLVVAITEGPFTHMVAGAVLAPLQPLVVVLLLRQLAPHLWGAGGEQPLRTTHDLVMLLLACVVGTGVAAAVRELELVPLPALDSAGLAMIWIRGICWTTSAGILALMVVPDLLSRRHQLGALIRDWFLWRPGVGTESLLIVAATAAIYSSASRLPVSFAVVLITVWASLRLSPVAATLHALTSGTVALLLTLQEVRFFSFSSDRLEAVALAQGFTIVLVLTAAAVSLLTASRRQAVERAAAAERAAEEKAALLKAAIERLEEGVVVLQDDGTDLERNPAGRDILQLDPGKPYDEVMPPPDFGIFDDTGRRLALEELPHARALQGADAPATDYLVRSPRRRQGVILRITATPLATAPGAPRRAVVNFRDVTTDRQERDALASFAGVVAHDLNNPLMVANGWALALREQFQRGDVSPEQALPMLDRVDRATKHMQDFISDLLAYTVARDQQLSMEDLDLSAIAEEVAAFRRDSDSRPQIDIQPGMRVHADAMLVRQVIDNLISNATKYVAPGVRPQVRVQASDKSDMLEIRVSDNGIGVPATMRGRIFDNFQRAHGATYNGTGLGLSICRRIVERHGGNITVEDDTEHGSSFVLTLPRMRTSPEDAPARSAT